MRCTAWATECSTRQDLDGLGLLQHHRGIAALLTEVRLPFAADGIGFVRAVRRRWPELPLAVVTSSGTDLDGLLGTPECPVLVLSKPVQRDHVAAALRLVLGPGGELSA